MGLTITNENGKRVSFKMFTFPGGERHVQIKNFEKSDLYKVRAALNSSDEIMDLLLACDALQELSGGCRIALLIPYMPYARQDRVCAPGQPFSMRVMADILHTIRNVVSITTYDIHSDAGCDLVNANNIPACDLIMASHEISSLIREKDTVIVCPDAGAVKRVDELADLFGKARDVVYCQKVRDPETGFISEITVGAETLEGKTAFIADDICDGGRTFTMIARALRELSVERVVLYVTHGIFSKGIEAVLRDTETDQLLIDKIFTTDTITNHVHPNLEVIKLK